MNKSNASRLLYLDFFRIVAAICVVIIHITASAIYKYSDGSSLQFAVTLINSFALFAVPAFIFISAYGFTLAYHGKAFSPLVFLKKRFSALLLPYVIWTLIYYFDQLYVGNAHFQIQEFLMHLMLGTAFYHLYFMPIIFQFYLLYWPLKYCFEKFKPSLAFIISVILFIVYVKGLPFSQNAAFINTLNALLPLKAHLKYADRFFMSYLPFFTLGIYLAIHREEKLTLLSKLKWLIFPLYLALAGLHAYTRIAYYVYKLTPIQIPFVWELSSVLSIVTLLIASKILEPHYHAQKLIPKLSAYTFTLYLAHPLILQLSEIKLSLIGVHSQTLLLLVSFILAVGIPLFVSYQKDRFKQRLNESR